YCSDVSSFFHSSSVFWIFSFMNLLYQAEKRERGLANEFEFRRSRIHDLKMPGILQCDEFCVVFALLRSANVMLAEFIRHAGVGRSVEQPLRNSKRKLVDR